MKSVGILVLAATALLVGLTSCDKRPTARFNPGDSVKVKATQIEGKVCLRTRFFQEDQYWVTLPGNYYVSFPIREREERSAMDAEYAAKYGTWGPKPWHDEGPFYESELEHAR